ncbi:hypothetical protein GCM10007094_43260 [Pseudovibrio japonicus]|uniref:Uncharacterized protein n=1 Tax=Pseudovibrio japonicus TaxID=366534 RepID=A0ABQ3EVS7_9HYPH|nr:hypothetical protein GCM10007094_43260 [Pseudovibrio japonicus]
MASELFVFVGLVVCLGGKVNEITKIDMKGTCKFAVSHSQKLCKIGETIGFGETCITVYVNGNWMFVF